MNRAVIQIGREEEEGSADDGCGSCISLGRVPNVTFSFASPLNLAQMQNT